MRNQIKAAAGLRKIVGVGARMTTTAVTALVLVAAVTTPEPNSAAAVKLSADTTALIMCGTTCPTPDDTVIDIVRSQYIAPLRPGDIDYVPVTTPQEFWPITGLFRLIGLALGDPRLFATGGPAWPDAPWWKLSGLFDRTPSQSLKIGADQLEAAIAANVNLHRLIYGLSQGAGVANVVKRRLAAQYDWAAAVPDIDFVLAADPNLPNGGLMSRFPGFYIPILDLLFNGPAATDTPFDTVVITKQYDGFTDFPLYPLNFLADLNAILGIVYVHLHFLDVSLPATDPTESPAYQGTYGDSSYYLFENPDLPLFGPLRTVGVPEPVIDVVEPFFRVLVELGYDRSIPPWEPTPARLIPRIDPVKLVVDLVNAVGQGINNALALVGLPPLLQIPDPVASPARQEPRSHVPEHEEVADTSRQMHRTEPQVTTPSGGEQEALNGEEPTSSVRVVTTDDDPVKEPPTSRRTHRKTSETPEADTGRSADTRTDGRTRGTTDEPEPLASSHDEDSGPESRPRGPSGSEEPSDPPESIRPAC